MKALNDPYCYETVGIDLNFDRKGIDCLDYFRTSSDYFDLAVHCAAEVGGRKGIDGSPLTVATNLALDSWFFNWLERAKVPRAIYFSSSAVYPTILQGYMQSWLNANMRLRESIVDLTSDSFGMPDQTYGWCKLTGEVLAQYSSAQVTIVRPFSGYSEDQSLDYPFPSFMARAQRRDDPFEIWGDGEQTRDWIHIQDVVDGALTAMTQGITSPVNLCSGIGVTFTDLAKMMCSYAHYEPKIEYIRDAPTGVHYRVGDPTKMQEFFTPKISLGQGIRRALA